MESAPGIRSPRTRRPARPAGERAASSGTVPAELPGVRGRAQKVQRHVRLVADDPGVVPRSDGEQVSRLERDLPAIVHDDHGASGHHEADVLHPAGRRPGDRLDVLRPFPSRLVAGAADDHVTEFHDLERSLLEDARLVGLLEPLDPDPSHVGPAPRIPPPEGSDTNARTVAAAKHRKTTLNTTIGGATW